MFTWYFVSSDSLNQWRAQQLSLNRNWSKLTYSFITEGACFMNGNLRNRKYRKTLRPIHWQFTIWLCYAWTSYMPNREQLQSARVAASLRNYFTKIFIWKRRISMELHNMHEINVSSCALWSNSPRRAQKKVCSSPCILDGLILHQSKKPCLTFMKKWRTSLNLQNKQQIQFFGLVLSIQAYWKTVHFTSIGKRQTSTSWSVVLHIANRRQTDWWLDCGSCLNYENDRYHPAYLYLYSWIIFWEFYITTYYNRSLSSYISAYIYYCFLCRA